MKKLAKSVKLQVWFGVVFLIFRVFPPNKLFLIWGFLVRFGLGFVRILFKSLEGGGWGGLVFPLFPGDSGSPVGGACCR